MHICGSADILSRDEIERILQQALRILAEIGIRLPNAQMQAVLADYGARVDAARELVFFPTAMLEQFFSATQAFERDAQAALSFSAGAYPQYYAEPKTGCVQLHTLRTVIEMTRLTDQLSHITNLYDSMGVPSDVPDLLSPLYMRLLVWKYTRKGQCGQVHLKRLLPYVIEMAQVMADSEGGSLANYAFLTCQMISPLQFGEQELSMFVYFWERGLKAEPGQILSSGGSAPATLAGTVALQVAENLVINLIDRFFYANPILHFSNSATVIDMKTAAFQYGRPELGLTHLAIGQIARYLGASFDANCFLGDAKVPSCEMGMQKALNAIPAILAGTRSLGTLVLLSVDEIGSPLQLILDDEYAGALQRFARGFEIDEDTLAYDLIREIGPGGLFIGTEHTARHYRKEHWQPALFSREMYNAWMAGSHQTDIERAADMYNTIMAAEPKVYLGESTEKALLQVIEKAGREIGE